MARNISEKKKRRKLNVDGQIPIYGHRYDINIMDMFDKGLAWRCNYPHKFHHVAKQSPAVS